LIGRSRTRGARNHGAPCSRDHCFADGLRPGPADTTRSAEQQLAPLPRTMITSGIASALETDEQRTSLLVDTQLFHTNAVRENSFDLVLRVIVMPVLLAALNLAVKLLTEEFWCHVVLEVRVRQEMDAHASRGLDQPIRLHDCSKA